MVSSRRKVLVIGMADSVHLGRWISQFVDQPIDFTLFPSSPHRHIHSMLKRCIDDERSEMTIRIQPTLMKWLAFPLSVLDLLFWNAFRAFLLRRVIRKTKFDLIHVLELQHAGYLLLDTELSPQLPKVFVTTWGSDIYWFRQFPKHKERIVELLGIAKIFSAECDRDIKIVRELGYTGQVKPVIPVNGGLDVQCLPTNMRPPSQRQKIIVKGYTGFVGRAQIAIDALEGVIDELEGYEVLIYSASLKARLRALRLKIKHGISVRIVRKRTSHADMLKLFSESRVYLGISLSDGISTSLLEAMATGCYPVQTNTGCACEWVTESSGSLVQPDNTQAISAQLREALTNDERVNEAAKVNSGNVRSRASAAIVIRKRVFFVPMFFGNCLISRSFWLCWHRVPKAFV